MKRLRCSQGSALTAAMVASAVLSIMLAGFMTHISNEYRLNSRSHRWNQAINLAEAAVEIGIAELNFYYLNRHQHAFKPPRGWVKVAQSNNTYIKTINNFTDGSGRVLGNLSVTVENVGTLYPKVAGVGTCPSPIGGPTISRAVQVTLKGAGLYPYAFTAKTNITLSGSSVFTDSFDSTDNSKSTLGQYDPAKRQPNGHIACLNNTTQGTSRNSGADIYGIVFLTPTAPFTMTGPSSVGATFVSNQRSTTVADGLAKGWIRRDLVMEIPDVAIPPDLLSAPSLGNYTGSGTISAGDWRIGEFRPGNVVAIDGSVRLYITGPITINGQGAIAITPGSRLEVYTTATSINIAGGGVVNGGGFARDNQWFVASGTNADFKLRGSASWIGTVYAPDSDVSLGGGSPDFAGALVARSISASGSVQFHYDESLAAGSESYQVVSWQELRELNGQWVP
jgi:hypothetical protein